MLRKILAAITFAAAVLTPATTAHAAVPMIYNDVAERAYMNQVQPWPRAWTTGQVLTTGLYWCAYYQHSGHNWWEATRSMNTQYLHSSWVTADRWARAAHHNLCPGA